MLFQQASEPSAKPAKKKITVSGSTLVGELFPLPAQPVVEAKQDPDDGCTLGGHEYHVRRGDSAQVMQTLAANSFDCVVTSPPYYWQRDYDVAGQLGQEKTIDEFVSSIANVMDEVKRVLAPDGVLFLNLGDTYYSGKGEPKGPDRKNKARRMGLRAVDASGLGVPRKTAIGIPWRVAIEMISRGWTLRSPIIWQRKSNVPEPSAKDRPWRSYEMLFMFSKSPRYFFDRAGLVDAGEEDIWQISDRAKSSAGLHSAAFPEQLVERCLKVGCRPGGVVLDPFAGTGTTLRVALKSGRSATGIDLSPIFCDYMAKSLADLSRRI
jgi:DNA modification methylase